MITNLRTSVGNRPLSLYALVTGPQVPTASLSKSNPITLDSFLVQAQQAAGGQIIPELNLNYYTSDIKSLPLNQKSNYCDPKDHTICGPGWFYLVSSELLSIKAICLWCTTVHVLTFALFVLTMAGTSRLGLTAAR